MGCIKIWLEKFDILTVRRTLVVGVTDHSLDDKSGLKPGSFISGSLHVPMQWNAALLLRSGTQLLCLGDVSLGMNVDR